MEYTPWLEKQIKGRMKVENPWWNDGQVPEDYHDMSPRKYINIFYPLVKSLEPRSIDINGAPTCRQNCDNAPFNATINN